MITAVDGKAVTGMDELAQTISQKQPGDQVQVSLLHAGQKRTVTVTLGDQPATATAKP